MAQEDSYFHTCTFKKSSLRLFPLLGSFSTELKTNQIKSFRRAFLRVIVNLLLEERCLVVNGLNKVTLDERSLRFKNFHTKSPLAPL